ncbi:MAG: PIG-L family deacetylase [Clostridia bacterium]|nr:PIG-L family deacetylase [Clostridia bacterium]
MNHQKARRRIPWELLLLAAVLLMIGRAGAEEAPDLTKECTFRMCSTKWNESLMIDGKYTSYWESNEIRNPWITISSETPMYGLYICFRQMPATFEIQVPETDEEGKVTWVRLLDGDSRFYHTYYPLEGEQSIRICSTVEKKQKMGVNEIYVFGKGNVPDWVQRWEETEEKADILFFSAHPDDEMIFLGGAIPTYAGERGKRVIVAYLSYSNTTRRSEALNGLWTMGVRHYPVFGSFRDAYSKKVTQAYSNAGKKKVLSWVTELYRKYQPEVVVTHDLNGEYGHGQHKMIADAAVQGYELAADPEKYPESAAKYGTWQVRKLYVHLYGENDQLTKFDWTVPLESFGGKTGLEVASEAYALHKTQERAEVKIDGQWHRLSVEVTGAAYDNTAFGLYASRVGPDVKHDDFLENIQEKEAD